MWWLLAWLVLSLPVAFVVGNGIRFGNDAEALLLEPAEDPAARSGRASDTVAGRAAGTLPAPICSCALPSRTLASASER